MKKTLIIASVVALGAMVSQAQGLVGINLSAGTLVSTNTGTGYAASQIAAGVTGKAYGSGAAGFYYELLVSTTSQPDLTSASTSIGSWLDTGVFGSSFATGVNAGKISAGSSVATTGSTWATPSGAVYDNSRFVEIIGWSGNYGTTFAAFLTTLGQGLGSQAFAGYFGVESGQNVAGGGPSSLPAVNQWGNGGPGGTSDGLNSALSLGLVTPVPEPTTMALVGLGSLSLLALRRKKA
jgi:hypothetical protein